MAIYPDPNHTLLREKLSQYTGQPARVYLHALVHWLRAAMRWLERGRPDEEGDGGAITLIKTTGTITARSGTTRLGRDDSA